MTDLKMDPQDMPNKGLKTPQQIQKEEAAKQDEEDSGYKMLDIAWEAYNSTKAIHYNLASMVWNNVLEEPFQAAKSAVKEKASEVYDSAKSALKEAASSVYDGASELAYDVRDKLISNSSSENDYQEDDELDSFSSLDDDSDDDDQHDNEFHSYNSDDKDSDDVQYDNGLQSTESEEIPMGSMQSSASANPAAGAANTMPAMPAPSSSGGGGAADLEQVVGENPEMLMML